MHMGGGAYGTTPAAAPHAAADEAVRGLHAACTLLAQVLDGSAGAAHLSQMGRLGGAPMRPVPEAGEGAAKLAKQSAAQQKAAARRAAREIVAGTHNPAKGSKKARFLYAMEPQAGGAAQALKQSLSLPFLKPVTRQTALGMATGAQSRGY